MFPIKRVRKSKIVYKRNSITPLSEQDISRGLLVRLWYNLTDGRNFQASGALSMTNVHFPEEHQTYPMKKATFSFGCWSKFRNLAIAYIMSCLLLSSYCISSFRIEY